MLCKLWFLHYFTQDWTDSNRLPGTGWGKTEFRSYQFTDDGGDNASLAETQESSQRRRGTETPLSNDEQLQLPVATEKAWENEFQTQSAKIQHLERTGLLPRPVGGQLRKLALDIEYYFKPGSGRLCAIPDTVTSRKQTKRRGF
ncbi:MAG: hypothetical protein M1816_003351 [Peltula sp. TS41687]|nr:MAG: hypothetical protein M1816_003351 [Peltula sp. TS41687]